MPKGQGPCTTGSQLCAFRPKLQENIETRRSLAERLQQNKTAGSVFFLVRDESQVQHADVGMQLGCYIATFVLLLLLWLCVCVQLSSAPS